MDLIEQIIKPFFKIHFTQWSQLKTSKRKIIQISFISREDSLSPSREIIRIKINYTNFKIAR